MKRLYFALFDDGLTLKTLTLAYICFCIQTLQSRYLCYNFKAFSTGMGSYKIVHIPVNERMHSQHKCRISTLYLKVPHTLLADVSFNEKIYPVMT